MPLASGRDRAPRHQSPHSTLGDEPLPAPLEAPGSPLAIASQMDTRQLKAFSDLCDATILLASGERHFKLPHRMPGRLHSPASPSRSFLLAGFSRGGPPRRPYCQTRLPNASNSAAVQPPPSMPTMPAKHGEAAWNRTGNELRPSRPPDAPINQPGPRPGLLAIPPVSEWRLNRQSASLSPPKGAPPAPLPALLSHTSQMHRMQPKAFPDLCITAIHFSDRRLPYRLLRSR
jgi:hypothetical protein